MKPLHTISKKVVVGAFAAALLVGGLNGVAKPAYAAESNSTVATQVQDELNQVALYAAHLLKVDYSDVIDDLKNGKSLGDVADAHKDKDRINGRNELKDALKSMYFQTVDLGVANGQITFEDAAQLKSNIETQLKDALDNKGVTSGVNTSASVSNSVYVGLDEITLNAAHLMDVKFQDVKNELSRGGSLGTIANEHKDKDHVEGREDLISQLKAMYSDNINSAYARGIISLEESAALKADLEKNITEAVDKKGYSAVASTSIAVDLNQLLENAAHLMDVDLEDVIFDLRNGQSLAQVANNHKDKDHVEGRADLIDQLEKLYSADVNNAYSNGTITLEEAAELKSNIEKQITEAVDTVGYNASVDTSTPLSNRVNFDFNQVAWISAQLMDVDYQDVLGDLRRGQSLASIAAEHKDEDKVNGRQDLIAQLKDYYAQTVNSAYQNGRITSDEVATLQSELVQKLTEIVDKKGL